MGTVIKKTVYLLKILPSKNNKKAGKYLAELNKDAEMNEEIVFPTTNDLKIAKKFNTYDYAEKEADFWLKCGHRMEIVPTQISLCEDEAAKIAEEVRLALEEDHKNCKLYDPENIVVINALVKQYCGIPPFKESKQDFLCSCCRAYIPFDALNANAEEAPSFCNMCGQRIDWTGILSVIPY